MSDKQKGAGTDSCSCLLWRRMKGHEISICQPKYNISMYRHFLFVSSLQPSAFVRHFSLSIILSLSLSHTRSSLSLSRGSLLVALSQYILPCIAMTRKHLRTVNAEAPTDITIRKTTIREASIKSLFKIRARRPSPAYAV